MAERMEERLLRCTAQGRLPQSLLLAGQPEAGQELLARRTAALYCLGTDAPERLVNCPNYREMDGRTVGVKQVRELMADTGVQSFDGGKRVFYIRNAHYMSELSQNALLKTLEEPPAETVMILSGSEMGLLPTVRSRCTILRLGAQPLERVRDMLLEGGREASAAETAAAASDGVPGFAEALLEPDQAEFRLKAIELFRNALVSQAPFLEATALITGMVEDPKTGERKKKADPKRAELLLHIWASVARDALMIRENGGSIQNRDQENLVRGIAARFTSERIQGIIEQIASAMKNLGDFASPAMTVDAVLGGMLRPCGQTKEKV